MTVVRWCHQAITLYRIDICIHNTAIYKCYKCCSDRTMTLYLRCASERHIGTEFKYMYPDTCKLISGYRCAPQIDLDTHIDPCKLAKTYIHICTYARTHNITQTDLRAMTLWFTDVFLKPAAARCDCCRAVVNVVNAA